MTFCETHKPNALCYINAWLKCAVLAKSTWPRSWILQLGNCYIHWMLLHCFHYVSNMAFMEGVRHLLFHTQFFNHFDCTSITLRFGILLSVIILHVHMHSKWQVHKCSLWYTATLLLFLLNTFWSGSPPLDKCQTPKLIKDWHSFFYFSQKCNFFFWFNIMWPSDSQTIPDIPVQWTNRIQLFWLSVLLLFM